MCQELLITHFYCHFAPKFSLGSNPWHPGNLCKAAACQRGACRTAGCNFGCRESRGKQPFNDPGEPASCRSSPGSAPESHPQPGKKKNKPGNTVPGQDPEHAAGRCWRTFSPFGGVLVRVDHLTEPAGEHIKEENHPEKEAQKPRWAGREG